MRICSKIKVNVHSCKLLQTHICLMFSFSIVHIHEKASNDASNKTLQPVAPKDITEHHPKRGETVRVRDIASKPEGEPIWGGLSLRLALGTVHQRHGWGRKKLKTLADARNYFLDSISPPSFIEVTTQLVDLLIIRIIFFPWQDSNCLGAHDRPALLKTRVFGRCFWSVPTPHNALSTMHPSGLCGFWRKESHQPKASSQCAPWWVYQQHGGGQAKNRLNLNLKPWTAQVFISPARDQIE